MPAKAHVLGPGKLLLGAAVNQLDFSCQITNGTITTDSDKDDDLPVLCGDVVPGETTLSATLEAEILQDYDLGGVIDFTWKNGGKELAFEFVPNLARAAKLKGTVTVLPMDIGGDVKKKNTSKVKWACVGMPALTFDNVPAGG